MFPCMIHSNLLLSLLYALYMLSLLYTWPVQLIALFWKALVALVDAVLEWVEYFAFFSQWTEMTHTVTHPLSPHTPPSPLTLHTMAATWLETVLLTAVLALTSWLKMTTVWWCVLVKACGVAMHLFVFLNLIANWPSSKFSWSDSRVTFIQFYVCIHHMYWFIFTICI